MFFQHLNQLIQMIDDSLPAFWFVAFDLFCQILPEEWLIERIQQVGANSRKPLSPSFVVIYRGIAVVFLDLRDIFVTDAITTCAVG